MPIQLQPDDWSDDEDGDDEDDGDGSLFEGEQTDVTGAMVLSTNGPTGQLHYVSPLKKTGDGGSKDVVIRAQLPEGLRFSDYFVFQFSPEDAGCQPAGDHKATVPRNKTGQFVVKVMAKPQGGAAPTQEITRINVWIVWADGEAYQNALTDKDARYLNNVKGMNNKGDAATFLEVRALLDWQFRFTIYPSSIVDTKSDIPKLDGPNVVPPEVPGTGTMSQSPRPTDLSLGVNFKWDMSRRFSTVIQNPFSIPQGEFDDLEGGSAYLSPVPNGTVIPFPDDSLIGNDDYANTVPENDNPYEPYDPSNTELLRHGVGQLSSHDNPTILLPHPAGSEGETCEQDFLAQEFVRLEIGGGWYVISDPLKWKVVAKEKFTGGQWIDDGSDFKLGN